MNEEQLSAWLRLSFAPKLGGVALSRLMSVDSPQNLVRYSVQQLQHLGLKDTQIQYIQQDSNREVEFCLQWQADSDEHHILSPLDPDYPYLLSQMSSHPPVLFIKGNLAALNTPQVAIVGSRHASVDGLKAAKDFAFQLAQQGLTITSGLALGIDGHAHDGALLANGTTVAVLGSGVEQVYPARHKGLAQRIMQNGGALVSELRPDAKPRAEHFPRRNRIISGLSQGVLVVEAAERSGSLITARYAIEQNRDVFALPGSIYQSGFAGTNRLLQQGAYLALSPQDIIDELNPHFSSLQSHAQHSQPQLDLTYAEDISQSANKTQAENKTPAFPRQALPFPQLLANVGNEATPVDILAERTHIPVHEVMMQILELELAGHVVSVPGGYVLNTGNKPK